MLGDHGSNLPTAGLHIIVWIDCAKLDERETGNCLLVSGDVAAIDFERLIAERCGESPCIFQLPAIDKAIVTRRAFQLDPQKHLRNCRSQLHLGYIDAASDLTSRGYALCIFIDR